MEDDNHSSAMTSPGDTCDRDEQNHSGGEIIGVSDSENGAGGLACNVMSPTTLAPSQDWLTSAVIEDSSFFELHDLANVPSSDFNDSTLQANAEAASSLLNAQGVLDMSAGINSVGCGQYNQPFARVPPETSLQRLYDLDMRLFKLSECLESMNQGYHVGALSDAQNGPIREVLDAFQNFVDLLTTTNVARGSDSPNFLLVSSVYTRLLSVYSDLIGFVFSSLAASDCSPSSAFSSRSGSSASLNLTNSSQSSLLFSGLGIQLAGLNVQGHDNLMLRIFVETCTYMLDRIDGVLGGTSMRSQVGGQHELGQRRGFDGHEMPPRPTVLDVVALAIRHDDLSSQESGKIPISSLNRNVQRLNQVLRMS